MYKRISPKSFFLNFFQNVLRELEQKKPQLDDLVKTAENLRESPIRQQIPEKGKTTLCWNRLKIDECLKIQCSQKLSTSYCWYTSGHLKTCFGIFITLHFFYLQGYMSYFRILIKNRLGKFQFIALYSLISTILWHQMLVWILPNMSGVVPSLFDIL